VPIYGPQDLSAALAYGAIDCARPQPVVVRGDLADWEALLPLPAAYGILLRDAPRATIAVVVGTLPTELEPLVAVFDLAAIGTESDVDPTLRDWLAAFERAPQACSTLAELVRWHSNSLMAESFAYSMLQAGPEHAAWLASRPSQRSTDPGPRIRMTEKVDYYEIRLTRPVRHNAIDAAMREELCDALDAGIALSPPAILLCGEGPSFCSGGDLDEFGTRRNAVEAHFVRSSRSPAARLRRVGWRTVAAVHGACFGAGIELAAFCHRIIAAQDTTLRLPETGFGLLPGSGGTLSIPWRIGRQRFLDMAVTGRDIDAETALAWGLVDEVVPSDNFDARVAAAMA
jgi:enoyl-CoA hydratase/carnithine racemase